MAACAHVQYMTPPAARGRCRGGSIACSDCGDHIYQCAKFGACFQKCTNIAYLGAKPLDYSGHLWVDAIDAHVTIPSVKQCCLCGRHLGLVPVTFTLTLLLVASITHAMIIVFVVKSTNVIHPFVVCISFLLSHIGTSFIIV